MTRQYLTVLDAVAIHDMQIREHGGASGLRDPGQLEAALFRPQSGYYGDILAEAAALWESLSQNHPFVDGNKRTALVCMVTFLHINDTLYTATDEETRAFVKQLYETGELNFERLEPWLRVNTSPV
ncbi:MAG: type II toxin-antitoxin system death-on-curing family toxin [Robiginitomaculum sp.]|nr:type II toxin-antitoxin system death-on-curing family toxin [Robiginitomaculum sp.]